MPPERGGGERVAAALSAADREWSRGGDPAELRRPHPAVLLDLDKQ